MESAISKALIHGCLWAAQWESLLSWRSRLALIGYYLPAYYERQTGQVGSGFVSAVAFQHQDGLLSVSAERGFPGECPTDKVPTPWQFRPTKAFR
jgi:hypothetical protein